MTSNYQSTIARHYESVWGVTPQIHYWSQGPVQDLPDNFSILEFPANNPKCAWIYATSGMWQDEDQECPNHSELLEIHLFSSERSNLLNSGDGNHIELLTMLARFHRVRAKIGLGHSVNFGRPWIADSKCTHGLISLPYLDGPDLEDLDFEDKTIRCLWLVPVTEEEIEFKKEHGLEALEQLFESTELDYLDKPRRNSVTSFAP